MGLNLIEIWNQLAVEQYHVNPSIFVFLMILSLPFYYYGWWGLAKEAVNFRKRYNNKKNHLKATDLLTEKGFLLPLFINRAAWVMPYVYVIFWGRNIPWWFWVLFLGWIGLSAFLFWNKLKVKIISEK